MKIHIGLFSIFLFFSGGLMMDVNAAKAQSETERNGFVAEEPLKYIKLAFAVKDTEKPIVGTIMDASNSIASFTKEVMASHANPSRSALTHVLPEARQQLRLPPEASNGTDRYVYSQFYCWKVIGKDQLQVQIEWADITTPQRYTDSYVFTKKGTAWYFSHHGNLAPFRYALAGYDFKRPCAN